MSGVEQPVLLMNPVVYASSDVCLIFPGALLYTCMTMIRNRLLRDIFSLAVRQEHKDASSHSSLLSDTVARVHRTRPGVFILSTAQVTTLLQTAHTIPRVRHPP